jgi:hypothetical protein
MSDPRISPIQEERPEPIFPIKLVLFVITVVVGFVLLPVIWGVSNGLILGRIVAANPTFQKEIRSVLSDEEAQKLDLARLRELPMEKRYAVEAVVNKYLDRVAWLPIHLVTNLLTFAILGLILGICKLKKYWFGIPICLVPGTLTILNGRFIVRSWAITLSMVVIIQILSIFLFAKIGERASRWRSG